MTLHPLSLWERGDRIGLDAERGINDGREAAGPVIPVAGEAADLRAIPAHHQPVAVVLDLVKPVSPGRRPGHLRRQARFNEAGWAPPLDHDGRIGQRATGSIFEKVPSR